MKTFAVTLFATLSLVSGAAIASADLAKAKNCMACHAMDKKKAFDELEVAKKERIARALERDKVARASRR